MQQSSVVSRAPISAPAPAPTRMKLSAVTKGRQQKPKRVVLYGVEKIGKSTFGANAPKPIFVGTEDGTSHLDVERFPSVEHWGEVKEAVIELATEKHDYQTLVLDTLDWAEPLLWSFICKRDSQANIEAYGYGKGYTAALDEWRTFLAYLERLQTKRGMNVILLAHAVIKPFKNPEGPDYDRYEMKLNPKASGLIKEWAEDVLFTNFETFANVDAKTKRVKGISSGQRLIYTVRCAAYDAGNRHNLPETLPLSYADFEAAYAARAPTDAQSIRAEIERKAKAVGGKFEADSMASLARIGDDTDKLMQLNNWINTKTGETAEVQGA